MYASGKPVWYLPFALLAFAFFFCAFVGLRFSILVPSPSTRHSASLTSIFSPNTIDALNRDGRLQDALLSLAEAIAETSTDLGDLFRFQHLKRAGSNLTEGVMQLRAAQRSKLAQRGLLQDMGATFGQILGDAGGAGGLNLTGGLSGILGSLGGSLTDSLSTPALFLGIGLGMGTSTGLNLTDMQGASAQGVKVANAYNASATGVNLIAQNFGSGVAGEILPSFQTSNISLGAAAFALATGIGNATAYGLNLTLQKALPSNDSGIEAVAGNFGLGIATPVVSNIDLQAVMNGFRATGASMFTQQLPQIAAAAGQGLGEGTRNGLGLTAPQSPSRLKQEESTGDAAAGIDIASTVSAFTKGLSQSFLTGSDLSKLNPLGGTNVTSMINLQTMLRPLAAGAGAGIGMGVAVGLNLKSAESQPTFGGNITGQDEQTALIAEGFVGNMLSNFLTNSTALQQAGSLLASSQPQFLKNVDGAKAAEGFARGTIEGVMSAMSSVGGLKNLISGQVPPNALQNVPVLQPSQFDDSVNGSAIGFARGLTGPGTILAAEVIRNLTGVTRNATSSSPNQERKEMVRVDDGVVVPYKLLSPRQDAPSSTTAPAIAPVINAQTLQMGVQKVANTVTCQGIGGLAAAGLGVMNAGKAKSGKTSSVSLDPRVLQSLPDGPIILISQGNKYQIVIKQASIEINGLKLVPFAVLTALHVLFSVLAFLVFLPLYLIFGAAWRFCVLAGHPVNEIKNRKWRMGFLITFAILGISGIVLGMVGMGKARHFRDQHGIFGLISFIFLFPAVASSIIRLRTSLPHPSSAAFAGIKGPIALARTPQKIYLISGMLTQLVLALGQFSFIQGFSTLRSISLCIIDAVLNSSSAANLVSILLMVQISATALVGVRAWLEQHIAKREAASNEPKNRKSSFQTFGFDRKNAPPPLNLSFRTEKPNLVQRRTEELNGYEDDAISTPFNVRKEGEIVSPLSPRTVARPSLDTPGRYDPNTGVYEYEMEGNNKFNNVPVAYQSPSLGQMDAGPKMQGVTTKDLFPPLEAAGTTRQNDGVVEAGRVSYSRPFGGGPGGTVRM
ncbi:hypothetical protein EK21DRAFT_108249 [Setomelanomma holmii]|uniref:Cytochrome b561 domain-containing protein n=1 Tax=Setomelanomma holmii TaxID=210430 RepID=A0A9P4HFV6_9PLEO|nr:hypothetical protein EK21DRAFT_108249 [Setomelanomma holmii]